MRRITLVVLICTDNVLAFGLQLTEASIEAVLARVLEHCMILNAPVDLSLAFGSQSVDLAWLENVASNLNFLALGRVTSIGPGVDARIVKPRVLELLTVNWSLIPLL